MMSDDFPSKKMGRGIDEGWIGNFMIYSFHDFIIWREAELMSEELMKNALEKRRGRPGYYELMNA